MHPRNCEMDRNTQFEFFHSSINGYGQPKIEGIRAIYGFGPDSFKRSRNLMNFDSGPFVSLGQDRLTGTGQNKRRSNGRDRNHPSYGWMYVSSREFMGPPAEEPPPPPRVEPAHADGPVLEVSGSPHADELQLPRMLRMKTAVEDPLGSTTIAGLIRAANDETLLPIISKSAAGTLIRLNSTQILAVR